jgi:short subunit dehydrogenase-like uncharacterized protein
MTHTRQGWLLYGATGFTGGQILASALAAGHRPVLGARDPAKVRMIADAHGLDWRVVGLEDPAALAATLREFTVVLHAVGPFLHTHRPMAEACLDAGTHYLDLAAESAIYEGLAALDARARDTGVMLMPGVGFEMVPIDCLALRLKRALPDATSLEIGMDYESSITPGSVRSAQLLPQSAPVRRKHRLVELDRSGERRFDFGPEAAGGGRSACISSVFGEAAITWRSTGIPDIAGYFRPNPRMLELVAAVKSEADFSALAPGPSDAELASCPAVIVGEVRNANGESRAMRLITPHVYRTTGLVAAAVAERVSRGHWRSGFQTPATVFGEDFILGFDGCRVEDWPAD